MVLNDFSETPAQNLTTSTRRFQFDFTTFFLSDRLHHSLFQPMKIRTSFAGGVLHYISYMGMSRVAVKGVVFGQFSPGEGIAIRQFDLELSIIYHKSGQCISNLV